MATDLNPGYRGFGPCYTDVEKRGARDAMNHYSDRNVLFISYPEDALAKSIINAFQGNKLILVSFRHDKDVGSHWQRWNRGEAVSVLSVIATDAKFMCYNRCGENPEEASMELLAQALAQTMAKEESCQIS